MRFKIVSRRILICVVLECLIIVIILGSYLFRTERITSVMNTDTTQNQEQTRPGLPLRLKIPKINLETEIEYVGLTANGEMATPEDIANVSWYQLGTRPGEEGSAVIAGHYGWKDGKASSFDELHTLRPGDKLYVEDDAGVITTFIVRENKQFNPEDSAVTVFTSNDDGAHLNLITCEGDWDSYTKSYSKRLVVFTDRE